MSTCFPDNVLAILRIRNLHKHPTSKAAMVSDIWNPKNNVPRYYPLFSVLFLPCVICRCGQAVPCQGLTPRHSNPRYPSLATFIIIAQAFFDKTTFETSTIKFFLSINCCLRAGGESEVLFIGMLASALSADRQPFNRLLGEVTLRQVSCACKKFHRLVFA